MTAAEVQELVDKSGLSVPAFAKRLGVSRMAVYRWLKGERTPTGLPLKALQRLAKRLPK